MTRLGGWTIEEFDAVASTNDVAAGAARAGAPDHSAFVAARQTGGKGRGARTWTSPPGGLYVSMLLRDLDANLAPLLPLVAGEALRRAVKAAAPEVSLWLKWPNDLLAAPRGATAPAGKLGGVLVQSASSGGGVDWAVVGVGVNLQTGRADLPDADPPAVTLAEWLATPPAPGALLDALLEEMNQCLFACAAGAKRFVADVERHLAYVGQTVDVRHVEPGAPGWHGTLLGLTPSGAVRLRVDGRESHVDHWHVGALRPGA